MGTRKRRSDNFFGREAKELLKQILVYSLIFTMIFTTMMPSVFLCGRNLQDSPPAVN